MISLIIPTCNKNRYLNRTLASLYNQTLKKDVEFIIVDDGDEIETRKVVDIWSRYLNIHYLRTGEVKGRASARNLAINKAKSEILVFLDDDMIVTPNFIQEHYNLHKNTEDLVVIGYRHRLTQRPTELFNFITPVNITMNSSYIQFLPSTLDERESIYEKYKDNLEACLVPWVCLYSNNFSVKKAHLIGVENFCEDFQKKWGVEDVELGYRLHKQGLRYVLSREANGYHLPHFVSWKNNLSQLDDNLDLFLNKYPVLEVELYSQYLKVGLLKYIESLSKFQEKALKQPSIKYSLPGLKEARHFLKDNIKGKLLLLGVGDSYIVNEFKPEVCFDPDPTACSRLTEQTGFENLLGVKTKYDENYFDTTLINDFSLCFYCYFPLVVQECRRISKTTLVIMPMDHLQGIIKRLNSCLDDMSVEEIITWFLQLGILEENLSFQAGDNLCFIKIQKQENPNRPKINLALSLDLDKSIDGTLSGVEMALSLEDAGCNIHIEDTKKFEYLSDLSGNKAAPKMNYLTKSERKRLNQLIQNNLRYSPEQFYELPISRITNHTTKIVSWFGHAYLGFPFNEHIEFFNSEVDIVWHYSECSAQYFLENGGDASKSFVVPGGVNSDFYAPRGNTVKKKKFVFMALVTPFKEHGMDALLDAFCKEFSSKDPVVLKVYILPFDFELQKGFYHTDISWDYYKKFLNQYKILYESKLEEYKQKYLNKACPEIKIEFCDQNPRKRLSCYQDCDCYVHLYRNDFVGDKIMQAMACEKPVIVLDKFFPKGLCHAKNSYIVKSDITTAVDHEYTSFSEYYLWANPEIHSVRKNMRQVFANKDEAIARGELARKGILDQWTWQHFAQRAVETFYLKNSSRDKQILPDDTSKEFDLNTLYNKFAKEKLLIY